MYIKILKNLIKSSKRLASGVDSLHSKCMLNPQQQQKKRKCSLVNTCQGIRTEKMLK